MNLENWPATSNKYMSSVLQDIEYHSSVSNGNQSTTRAKRDESGQGMDLILKPTDNQTLQHEDHPKNVSGQRFITSMSYKRF